MEYRCSLYGLGVVANRVIPGVPASMIGTEQVRLSFGALPAWLRESNPESLEPYYTSDHTTERGEPALSVFRVSGGRWYWFRYADRTTFVVDRAGRHVWAEWIAPLTLADTTTYLLGPIMGFVMLVRGIVALHASAVAIGNEAVALLGPAGAGKSTTAAALSHRGYRILADDLATLDDQGTRFIVRPGYPRIRLWPASVDALYGSSAQLPALTPTWDKRYLDLTTSPGQFQTGDLPLRAIYLLGVRRDEPAAPSVVPLHGSAGLMSLVANTYASQLMDRQMRARGFELLNRVLNHVPLRLVTPHADPARIPDLCARILDDVRSIGTGMARDR